MRSHARLVRLAALLAPVTLVVGCNSTMKEEKPAAAPSTMPATMPAKMANGDMPMAPMTVDGATHTVTGDHPYYKVSPMQSAPPAGTLKAGTQVKLLVPGAAYSKVEIGGGMTVYTSTEALHPI